MDKYGKNGGFLFMSFLMGAIGDEAIAHKNFVLMEEGYVYGHNYYKK
jgi:hypothetical protein